MYYNAENTEPNEWILPGAWFVSLKSEQEFVVWWIWTIHVIVIHVHDFSSSKSKLEVTV